MYLKSCRLLRATPIALVVAAWLCTTSSVEAPAVRADAPLTPPPAAASELVHPAAQLGDERAYLDPVSAQGQSARGLYFSADVVAALGATRLISVVKSARMNAVVIDLKDERGHVYFDTKLAELQRSKRDTLGDVRQLFRTLHAAGIYVITRIVCFSDPIVTRLYPERAVRDGRPSKHGALWATWGHRNPWLDPYNEKNHTLLIELAREIEALGADELQLDYVRFPVDVATAFAVFPAQAGQTRDAVLLRMLERMDRAVHVPLGADVFGVTVMPWHDDSPLGQKLEAWTKYVEVFSPMLYLYGMRAWHTRDPDGRAGRLIALGVATLRERLGPVPVIRPFLQGFEQGADHYDPSFIAEQIAGARRSGADGFLFWHSASRYSMVRSATVHGPADDLLPFPATDRSATRRAAWSASALVTR